MNHFSVRFLACTAAIALTAFCPLSVAQHYPSRAIRLVVPFAPGGSTDTLARIVGQRLTETLGQPVIIDNRPAGGGTTGSDLVAKANPDGYTLLIGSIATMAFARAMYAKLPYDPMRDFEHIGLWVTFPLVASIVPGYEGLNFHGLHAPAKLPRALVAKLHEETTKILRRPDVQEKLHSFAMDIAASRPDEYRSFIKAQIERWTPLIKASGARVD